MKPKTTGSVMKEMVVPAMLKAGFQVKRNIQLGTQITGQPYTADIIAWHETLDCDLIISLAWQQSPGSAEQKIPYKALCLRNVLDKLSMKHWAFIVLGGEGWSKKVKSFYLNGGLNNFIHMNSIYIMTLEEFVSRVNKGILA